MGAGIHGGFGKTYGSRAIAASPIYVGKGIGEELAEAARNIKAEKGYIDVVIHGTPEDVQILQNGKWEKLNQRMLANKLKHDPEYNRKDNIRLISCGTGAKADGFAQNLANKLGKTVKAPSDTLWVFENGKTSIGKTPFKNTGQWIIYSPKKKGK